MTGGSHFYKSVTCLKFHVISRVSPKHSSNIEEFLFFLRDTEINYFVLRNWDEIVFPINSTGYPYCIIGILTLTLYHTKTSSPGGLKNEM